MILNYDLLFHEWGLFAGNQCVAVQRSSKQNFFTVYLQAGEEINSQPERQRVQTQVQHTGQCHCCSTLRLDLSSASNLSSVLFDQPKPANTPTPPRPQGQPSPSIVVQQPVYGQTVCFPQVYPLTPVSPGVQVGPPAWVRLLLIMPFIQNSKVNESSNRHWASWRYC